MLRLVVIGAGGFARDVIDAARTQPETEIVGIIGTDRDAGPLDGVPVIGTDDDLPALRGRGVTHAVIGVGSLTPGGHRVTLFDRALAAGLDLASVVHRDATISARATVGDGSVVLARAVIAAGSRLGRNVIVYSGGIVEHDCGIGDHAHLSPGVTIGGGVRVGAGAYLGIGATVIQGITIGDGAFVAAGAVVTVDVAPSARVAGVPARPMG